jgi:hypothetical protein
MTFFLKLRMLSCFSGHRQQQLIFLLVMCVGWVVTAMAVIGLGSLDHFDKAVSMSWQVKLGPP